MVKSKMKIKLMIATVVLLAGITALGVSVAGVADASETLPYSYRYSADGGVDGLNFAEINDADEHIAGNPGGVVFSNEYGGGTGARIANSFAFKPQGDSPVFDVTFSGYFGVGHMREVNLQVGLAFGLPSPDAPFAQGTFVGIGNPLTVVVGNGVPVAAHERYPAYAEAYNERITLRVVGGGDGKVTVYRGYTMAQGTQSIDEVLAEYEDVKTDGYIAFGVYNQSDSTAPYNFTVTDFSVRGQISADVRPQVSVKINRSEFKYAWAGMPPLPLTSTVRLAPGGSGFSREVTYSVESGDAEIADGCLKINGEGEITLRAQSVANSEFFDTVTFTPKAADSYACEPYSVSDQMSEHDESVWTLDDPKGRASFGRGFSVTGDYREEGYEGVKAVSKVRYSALERSVVFDMTLRSYGYYRYNTADRWGFAFGLAEQDSKLTDDGAGYLWMSTVGMGLAVAGRETPPEYVKPYNAGGVIRMLDSAVYADTYNEAFVIRLIAYRDGTLELYRTQAGHESLGELKARWRGLNFDGYVALATNSEFVNDEITAQSGANFREFTVTGTALDDGNTSVTGLKIDRDVFIDVAQVEPPLELKAFVTAKPSFDKYKQVDWRVVSGSATINDGKISFGAAGEVTVSATARENAQRTDTYTFTVKDFRVNGISIDRSKFQNVTDFTQPVELDSAAALDSTLLTPKYNAIDWQVVSGPARVQGGRLRILGTGKVTLRAVARFDPSKTDTVTFTVDSYYPSDFPVLAVVLPIAGAVLAGAAAVVAVLIVKKKKRKKI